MLKDKIFRRIGQGIEILNQSGVFRPDRRALPSECDPPDMSQVMVVFRVNTSCKMQEGILSFT